MNRFVKLGFALSLFLFGTGFSVFSQNIDDYAIIPLPKSMVPVKGYFVINQKTVVAAPKILNSDASLFADMLKELYGLKLNVYDEATKINFIRMKLNPTLKPDAYSLVVNASNVEIVGGKNGVFYGLQTLLQLVKSDSAGQLRIPCVNIMDEPRFGWRGMHLDVSRHFFPKAFIKKYIDYLAAYKMNTFHWHLTDDQGWRIEIKKYPKLTQIGGWRKGTLIGHSSSERFVSDSVAYGGFYTQEDIREIVAYAEARHITIVPEIEMPGHAMAAISAYPFLSCSGKQIEVEQTWGVFEDVFCTKDSVFGFLENVLTEVMGLFPGTYIHVGGDECPKVAWKKCPVCQARIKELGLKDEYELQSYFIKRIEKFLSKHNRKLIGWDEILQGGLSASAAVMSWQGVEGGIAAAKQGNYVVMTPGSHCYFDHYQGDPTNEPLAIGGYTTVEKVYSYEPIPAELTTEQQKYILGAQGNLWTEYVGSEKQVEYMIFPRMCALSEVVWSPKEGKNYSDFRSRLLKHFHLFDKKGIHYAKSIFEINKNVIADTIKNQLSLELTQVFPSGDLYYWIEDENGYISERQKYVTPIVVKNSCTIFAESRDDNEVLKNYVVQKFYLTKSSGASVRLTNPPSDKYNYKSPYTLVDGVSGSIPWNGKEWLGFVDTPMEALIDLGKVIDVSEVLIHALKAEASWIYLPKVVRVEVSVDGEEYVKLGELNESEITQMGRMIKVKNNQLKARYIKVYVEGLGLIGKGRAGEGHNAWLFISEIGIE